MASPQSNLDFRAALNQNNSPTVPVQPVTPEEVQAGPLSLGLGGLSLAGSQAAIDAKAQQTAFDLALQKAQMDQYDQAIADVGNAVYNGGTYGGGAGNRGGYNTKYGLEPNFWSRLAAANAAMKAAGLGTFSVSSGYRTNAQQRALYAAHVAGKKKAPVAKPGTSKHEIGMAADLNLNKKQLRWLEQHGKDFGIYHISSETWHWQPS